MPAHLLRRLAAAVPLLAVIAVGTFSLTFLIPGDTAATVAGEGATPQRIEEVRHRLGLDASPPVQFARWAGDALHGDFGTSTAHGVAVTHLIGERLGTTLSLVGFGLVVAVAVGVPAGLAAGLRAGRPLDRIVTAITTLGIAVPAFWLAALLIAAFAVRTRLFPATGYVPLTDDPAGWLRSMVLPGLAIGAASAADVARQTRAAVADTAGLDHVRTSRALGLTRRSIAFRHVLRNSGIPIVTVAGVQVERLLGAAVVVELMFAMPGLGQLSLDAVRAHDIPTIQGIVLVTAVLIIVANLLVDLTYGWFDPRLRRSAA
ncbi:ABC transporter permease [Actinomadura atramentaria]|uniref:ABC transporter permease n=1 Tax=Actinomadura atramentaria TaxID=1990 RepID=UPI0003605403|nr:ABC transporter permease [Actinomadura atramentaria]